MSQYLSRDNEFFLSRNYVEYNWNEHHNRFDFEHRPTGARFSISRGWILYNSRSAFEDYILYQVRLFNYRLQSPDEGGKDTTMLMDLIRMYNAAMRMNVRSLIPHLVGPPGVGKSEVMDQLADAVGATLHTINVSRLSPLEIEGIQMPHGEGIEMRLQLLLSTMWSNLKDGDIVLFDEFLRGFPEVYNGLLDIISSRKVAGHELPKVFFVAASNSVATYDRALEDRLLHIYVPDIRTNMGARMESKRVLAAKIGLIDDVIKTSEMDELFTNEVQPTYKMLDYFKGKASLGTVASVEGKSVRHLSGQAHLREVRSSYLKALIVLNNQIAISQRKWQYVVLLSGKNVEPKYVAGARKLVGNPLLTEIQANNLALNLDLIDIEEAMQEEITITQEGVENDDVF